MTKSSFLRVFATSKIAALMIVSGMAVGACDEDTGEVDENTIDDVNFVADPAGLLGDEEWFDEGPPANDQEVPSTFELDVTAGLHPMLAPSFQLPFPCGQVWAGQTRTNHSPQNSVDFNRANDEGDTVVAAYGGKVSRVANEGNTSYGRWVEVDHGSGYRTRYAHLSVQSVSVGQTVAKGQKLGAVGNTGGSTGAHLHYEQRLNGVAQRPVFNGSQALFYGTKNYTSNNSCSGGGTGSGHAGTVNTSGLPLTIRSTASTSGTAVGSLADGAHVTITCQKQGSSVKGTYGTSTLWDFVGKGYISDAYVNTGSNGQVAPTCK